MKKIILAAIIVFTIALNCSCSSDDDRNTLDNDSISAVVTAMNSGTWRVTKYIDGENNETADFSGYNFTFTENNILMASKDDEIMGSWLVVTDDSNGRSSNTYLDFIISFSGPAKFLDLTDDWDIRLSTANKLELVDGSGGDGATDYLTFEKN
ncbi:hypothetical protein [Flavobacterium tegetincola]|uniref:hypothetical protein n=1 Tax=Flavobacterium tegetincola TaxID=150172 RepID=UPI00047ADF1E|nr:hypothetical protein [Flavobacterium tegetincola]